MLQQVIGNKFSSILKLMGVTSVLTGLSVEKLQRLQLEQLPEIVCWRLRDSARTGGGLSNPWRMTSHKEPAKFIYAPQMDAVYRKKSNDYLQQSSPSTQLLFAY